MNSESLKYTPVDNATELQMEKERGRIREINPKLLKYLCKVCQQNRKEWASPMCHRCQQDPNAKILAPLPIKILPYGGKKRIV